MRSVRHIVLQVVALHARRPKSSILPAHDLEDDLDMTPLELVLVALELEDIVGVDLDVTGLEGATTVAELLVFFERAVAEARRGEVDEVA